MMKEIGRFVTYCGLLAVGMSVSACGKSPGPATPGARVESLSAAKLPGSSTATADNVVVHSSESIATNAPDPNCSDCRHPDAGSSRDVFQKPLDPAFLDDLKLTIDLKCKVLEDGVAILESHAKTPATAEAALLAYREKHKAHMAELDIKTRNMAAQLKSLGFESDIPEEVKAGYEERMGKSLARLEALRSIYAKQPAALEAFGPFIRSPE